MKFFPQTWYRKLKEKILKIIYRMNQRHFCGLKHIKCNIKYVLRLRLRLAIWLPNRTLFMFMDLLPLFLNFFFWKIAQVFFFDIFDGLTQNFMLIPNLSLFQWLLLYLKRYRPLQFKTVFGQYLWQNWQNWTNFLSVCRFGYVMRDL